MGGHAASNVGLYEGRCVKKSLFVRHARSLQVCVPSSLARAGRFKRDSIALGQEGLELADVGK